MFLFSISRVVSSSKSTLVDISGITDDQITITLLLLTVIVVKNHRNLLYFNTIYYYTFHQKLIFDIQYILNKY